MQTVRLMHPELQKRSFMTKIKQMLEALRLERHFTKKNFRGLLFACAVWGTLKGSRLQVKLVSERPNQLTMSEAALLVALPQSPEVRRPDLFPNNAFKAKDLFWKN